MNKIVNWLKSLPNVSNPQPVTVTIKGVKYEGAKYNSKQDERETIYLVGEASSFKKPSQCYRFPNDDRDWYIAAYTEKGKQLDPDFHPFGPNFILLPWDVTSSKIDTYERKPYKRIPIDMEVETTDNQVPPLSVDKES